MAIVDSAPTASSQFTGNIDRIRYDLLRIGPALSRDFLHISSQRIPFDIQIFDNWAGTGSSSIVTTIENVWFESIGYSYQAQMTGLFTITFVGRPNASPQLSMVVSLQHQVLADFPSKLTPSKKVLTKAFSSEAFQSAA